ncbi:MAG: fibronectin type III domain-containing protein [Chitinophagaceae bacterium]|nr:MAG: fibronectin type III domain-containing protein [Chitinophagaceae bacterium]
MKQYSLTIIALALSTSSQAQCPTNSPSNLKIENVTTTTMQLSFNASASGATNATGYLVLASKTNTAPTPVAGTDYSSTPMPPFTIVYSGPNAQAEAKNLEPGTKYFFWVFAYAGNPRCYHSSPLHGEQLTMAKKDTAASTLGALLNFNFAGKQNGWSNLTPIIYYGWSTQQVGPKKYLGHTFQVGPYVGSTIAIKDSSSYLPAVMLPGNAGLEANYYITIAPEKKFRVVVCPLNLGLKVVSGFKDSNIALVQHNIRHAVGFEYEDKLSMSVQYTQGWHNSTPLSQENFEKVFKTTNSHIAYWNVTLTTRLSESLFGNEKKSPLYLSLNWRSLARSSADMGLPNARIFTIGLLASLDLKTGTNPGMVPRKPL